MALFPLTLHDEAKQWANSLEEGLVTTWDNFIEKFMKKFFPPIENERRKRDFMTFEQRNSENLIDVWRRFKRMKRDAFTTTYLDVF